MTCGWEVVAYYFSEGIYEARRVPSELRSFR